VDGIVALLVPTLRNRRNETRISRLSSGNNAAPASRELKVNPAALEGNDTAAT
jgi:hypothetical protein